MVRAKVQCYSIKEQISDIYRDGKTFSTSTWSYEFKFAGGHESEENAKFWSASPFGTLTLGSVKNNLYSVGQWYYLDWIPTTIEGTNG